MRGVLMGLKDSCEQEGRGKERRGSRRDGLYIGAGCYDILIDKSHIYVRNLAFFGFNAGIAAV